MVHRLEEEGANRTVVAQPGLVTGASQATLPRGGARWSTGRRRHGERGEEQRALRGPVAHPEDVSMLGEAGDATTATSLSATTVTGGGGDDDGGGDS